MDLKILDVKAEWLHFVRLVVELSPESNYYTNIIDVLLFFHKHGPWDRKKILQLRPKDSLKKVLNAYISLML